MKKKWFLYFSRIMLALMLPYLITILVNGPETAMESRKFDVEMFLPVVVYAQISDSYEKETIKAQAVIARTNFYRRMDSVESLQEIAAEVKEKMNSTYSFFIFPKAVFEKAVAETKGKVLTWNQELKLVPYHEISAGRTRDGEEVFHDEEYAYLKSVDSKMDKSSPEYLNSSYIKEQQMPGELEIKERDSAGYVTELLADGNILLGEAFRMGMGLSSASFTIQRIGGNMRFL